MKSRSNLPLIGIALVATLMVGMGNSAAQEPEGRPRSGEEVPALTVEELAATFEKSGYQALIGRQITFPAVVAGVRGEVILASIEGVKHHGFLHQAYLHGHLLEDILQKGNKITVTGMFVGQDFGVWHVWVYRIDSRPVGEAPPPKPPGASRLSIRKAILSAEGYVRQKEIDTTDMDIASAVFQRDAKRPHWEITWRSNQKELKGGWFRVLVYEDYTIEAEYGE